MKIIKLGFAVICALLLSLNTKASFINLSSITPKTNSVGNPRLTPTEQLRVFQMQRFAKMTLSDYEALKGRNLNYFEKLSFKLSQHRITKMLKHYENGDGPTTLSKISWFIKGLLFGPLALIFGYIFLKDDDRQLIKWIWFGFAGFLITLGIIFLVV